MNQKKINFQNYIFSIIKNHPDIRNYFQTHVNPLSYQTTVKDLLLQAIQNRNQNSNQNQNLNKHLNKQPQQNNQKNLNNNPLNHNKKHYQVVYMKQQKFLSPRQKFKQRQNVTPKVTEIIPIQDSSKHVIYGKPRVRIDNQGGCPQHEYDCLSPNKQLPTLAQKQKVLYYNQNIQNNIDPQQQYSYLKPTYNNIKTQEHFNQVKKQKENLKEIQKSNRKIQTQFASSQVVRKINNYNGKKNPGKIRNMSSAQKYKNIKSKIKFLVDKDKKEKKITEQLQKQKQKINQLERRQNYLTHKIAHEQQPQSFIIRNYQKNCFYEQSSSENSCSSGSSQQINEELIRKYHKIRKNKEKKKIRRQQQHENYDILRQSFSCRCSRTLQSISSSQQNDESFSKFDVKAFLANQRQYNPGYSGHT